jgi:hypothetical protein
MADIYEEKGEHGANKEGGGGYLFGWYGRGRLNEGNPVGIQVHMRIVRLQGEIFGKEECGGFVGDPQTLGL